MQVVGYRTAVREDGPALVVADDGEVSRLSLASGARLDYGLGERHCAGAVDDDAHYACSDESAPYCPVHSSTWVCARCTGDCLKDEMDCHEDHAIYLAAFAPDVFKVGVTREWRLDTRLREQGAQRAAHLETVSNGRLAREIESDIATEIPDRVRVPAKLDGLHEAVDADAWGVVLAGFDPIETFAFDYGLDLASQPVATTVARGTVVGTRGRVLVLERGATNYAVDLRDLVGHELDPEKESSDRQSSLASYV
ncbi:DUF2797 domain-containing protein [Salarchaeum sp. JOR-1]|uniref:DUF2797 domain-containing protein n=1 Tax=Salarchaeum sp. JOR-1 TaxID=2599399 RepID=UPI0011985470|nr:DUF2797 domain-containing protein [Salarchaeum sp. JOR-1]QDX39551.1 DUF2797 domain-containing protein [Salarchaeum sp. JOR-1]